MEKEITQIKQKFDALDKPVKILICFILILILGSILFVMGKQIGEVIYKAYVK